MQQWEYLFLTLTGTGKTFTSTSTQAKYRVNGEILQIAKQMSVFDVCNQFGEQGWEMIGQAVEGGDVIFTFKRPKAG
jgi:hypothetical protein